MVVDISSLDLNDPLLEAAGEIFVIEDYREMMEAQIEHIQKTQRLKLEAQIGEEKLTPNDPEWYDASQEYYHWVDFLLPRFFRGPFLVSLYAVYESVVTEIASLIQAKHPCWERLPAYKKKERLSFLERSKKYFSEVIGIDLCPDQTTWSRLVALLELRHALAHTNGRIDQLRSPKKDTVLSLIHSLSDVEIHSGFIIFGKRFIADTTGMVTLELRRLIEATRESCRAAKEL